MELRGWRVGIYALPIHACYFTITYLILKTGGIPEILDTLLLILSLWLYFSYGVLVNDLFDRDIDLATGKLSVKRGHTLTEREIGVILILLLSSNILVISLISGGVVFNGLWIVAYILTTFYSAPPTRWRRRGLLGFLTDSVIEKPLPVLIVFAFFRYYGFEILLFPLFAEMLDSIFKHQVDDYEVDVKSGIRTFTVELGRERSERIVQRLIHPLNMVSTVSLILISLLTIPEVRWLTFPSAFILLIGLLIVIFLKGKGRVRPGFPFQDPPLAGYLNFGFRTIFIASLTLGAVFMYPQYISMSLLVAVSIGVYLRDFINLVPDLLRYIWTLSRGDMGV